MGSINKISADCSSNQEMLQNIKQQLESDIKDKLSAQSEGVLTALGGSETERSAKIKNTVESRITQEQISEIINATNLNQELKVKGDDNNITDITMQMTSDMMMQASQGLATQITNDLGLKSTSTSESEAKSTPLKNLMDGIGNIFSSFTGLMAVYALAVVLVIGAVIYGATKVLSSGDVNILTKGGLTIALGGII